MGSLEALALLQSVGKVETVRDNYKGFTKQDVKKAVLAHKAQAMVGSPSERHFAELVSKNCTALKTIPVTCSDLTNARAIFGPDLSGVRGKTVRQKPDRVETKESSIPQYFYGLHKFLTLTADVMFVNSVPFLVTLSCKIRLLTVEFLPSRTAAKLSEYLVKVSKL